MKILLMILVSLMACVGCQSAKKSEPLKVYLMISADWEADTLREKNLEALKKFNKDYPKYPVIHFINAAYYTKKNFMSADEITKKVRSVLKPSDELGLHIHCWENLVRAAGVTFRSGPSFWGKESKGRGGERGDDVPLNLYSADEIEKLVKFSLMTLKKHGFEDIASFRGGGWISGPKVYKALVNAGIYVDSSAVPPHLIGNLYPDTNLLRLNEKLWPKVTMFSMPHKQPGTNGKLIQYPNNIGLADYVTGEEFFETAKKIIAKAKEEGRTSVYLHYGFHQESAVENFRHKKGGGMKLVRGKYLERVRKAIDLLEDHVAKNDLELKPVTFKTYPQTIN